MSMLFRNLILLILVLLPNIPLKAQDGDKEDNHNRDYKTALRKLKKGKSIAKFTPLLETSLSAILNSYSEERNKFLNQPNIAVKEKALSNIKRAVEKIEKSEAYLDGQFDTQKKQLIVQQMELQQAFASEYFDQGQEQYSLAESENNKHLAQKAYYSLQSAKRLGHTDGDLGELIKSSEQLGVVIYLVDTEALWDVTRRFEIDQTFDDIEQFSNKFRKITYGKLYRSSAVDCSINIKFKGLDIDTEESENSEDFSKEIVVGTETITNTDGEQEEVEKKETVEGTLITKTLQKKAEWDVDVSIHANTKNCNLNYYSISESLVSETVETEIKGDERAIPKQDWDPFKEELMSDKEMAKVLLEKLYSRVVESLF